MKNLRVNMKFFWPHITILLVLVTGIVISFVSFSNIRKQVEILYNGPFALKSAVNTVNVTLEAMQMSVYRAVLNNDREDTDEAATDTRNGTAVIEEQIALLKKNILGDMDTLLKLEKNLSELAQMQEHVLALVAQNNPPEAVEYMENTSIPAIKEIQMEFESFIQAADAKEIELMASLRQTQKNTITWLIFLGVASVLFSIGAGTYIWKFQKRGIWFNGKSKAI